MAILGGDDASAITTDPTTSIGFVRLLITDLDEAVPLFTDAQITAFLTAEGGVVKRAAAIALETIARSEVLVSKRISTQDLSVDGPAVAAELRASATELRGQAAVEVEEEETSDYGLDIVPPWTFPDPAPWGGCFP